MRLLFYALALAFCVWLIVAARSHDADPATLTFTTDPPDPPPEPTVATPPVTGTLARELGETRRQLAASRAARVRERRGYRRRLQIVIHSTTLPGHWLERAFLCVHAGEGSWRDPNPPYWGGLQFDMSFQRSYGDWALRAFGTADRWPASVQVATAIHAWASGRGFYPWPNTARACGLIR